MTDQGALIIHQEKELYRGSFLPLKFPGGHFFSSADEQRLRFNCSDGKSRWQGSLGLVRDGYGIEGEIQLEQSLQALPCQGRRIGSAADDGRTALLAAFEYEDPWLRREAAHALGALGPAGRDAIPGLIHALRDPDEEVLRAIHHALAKLGVAPESSVPTLRCHLKDDIPRVRSAAADALGELGAQAVDALPGLVPALEDADVAVRAAALAALAAVAQGKAVELAELLNDEGPALARRVLEGFRRKGPSAKAELKILAENLKDPSAKEHARAALDQVLATPAIRVPTTSGLDWPQWRGPHKDNVSRETGLLKLWPPEGPPLTWEVWGVGDGIAAPAVRDGRVFVLGHLHGWEYLTALDAENGRRLWSVRLGPGALEASHMRWVSQRTPTVGPDLVYTFLNSGELVCLRTQDGTEAWRLNYAETFGIRSPYFGLTDHPILDGDRLICTPATPGAMLAALDARSGRLLWKSPTSTDVPRRKWHRHPSTIVMEIESIRIYVVSADFLHGFRASDGKHLWTSKFPASKSDFLITPTLVAANLLLVRNGGGITLFQATGAGDRGPERLGSASLDDGWLHDSQLVLKSRFCTPGSTRVDSVSVRLEMDSQSSLDLGTGSFQSSLTAAEDRLYVLANTGMVLLVESTETGLERRSSFEIPHFMRASGTTNPVIAGGRLHLRDGDRLLCFDIRESPPPGPRRSRFALEALNPPPPKDGPPRAVFVPTPRDIVDRMLDLAETKASDVVADLGSGDGRILIAAAQIGAQAVGWEIDPFLVQASRREVDKQGLGDVVRIEEADLFKADLTGATVVALYLTEEDLTRLKPQLAKLRPGARIVSHQSKIPGLKPDRTVLLTSREDSDVHAVHLWNAPLKLN